MIKGLECSSCGHKQVTSAVVCSKCGATDIKPRDFKPEGSIVSFTIIGVPPEVWIDEAPYAFVIVQLDDGVRCTGWMPYVKRPEDIKIGDRVRFIKTYKPGMVFEKIS